MTAPAPAFSLEHGDRCRLLVAEVTVGLIIAALPGVRTPTDHVTRACCFQADTGIRAARCARRIVKAHGGAYGELLVGDGTGQYVLYTAVGGSR